MEVVLLFFKGGESDRAISHLCALAAVSPLI